ncbi:MAG: hypothetical protein CM1200mP2_50930 [Planctomycetaceae bacterium]|nr:MAG: hypothetical protein CM1200mP2_50930 [Planctomycetaceae bacterium]
MVKRGGLQPGGFRAPESEPVGRWRSTRRGHDPLARWCASREIRLVHVSSDFVFGSIRLEICRTPSRMRPVRGGAYAVSKLGGELHVRSGCPDHLVVRTCGLYGHAARRRERGGKTSWRRCCDWPPGGAPPESRRRSARALPRRQSFLAAAIDAPDRIRIDRTLPNATCSGSTPGFAVLHVRFSNGGGLDVEVKGDHDGRFLVRRRRDRGTGVLDCSRLVRDTGYSPTRLAGLLLTRYLATRVSTAKIGDDVCPPIATLEENFGKRGRGDRKARQRGLGTGPFCTCPVRNPISRPPRRCCCR